MGKYIALMRYVDKGRVDLNPNSQFCGTNICGGYTDDDPYELIRRLDKIVVQRKADVYWAFEPPIAWSKNTPAEFIPTFERERERHWQITEEYIEYNDNEDDLIMKNKGESQSGPTVLHPYELLNIQRDKLVSLKDAAQLVWVRGIYNPTCIQDQHGNRWASITDETTPHKLELTISNDLAQDVENGSFVLLGGIVTYSVSVDGSITPILRVSRLEVLDKDGKGRIVAKRDEIRKLKVERGYKDVTGRLEDIIIKDEKPKVGLVISETSITKEDFDAGIKEAAEFYDIREYRVNYSDPYLFWQAVCDIDRAELDAIAFMRGGGKGLEKVNHEDVVRRVASCKTPTIAALGHAQDKLFFKEIVDKVVVTPTALGQYLADIVESAKVKKEACMGIVEKSLEEKYAGEMSSLHQQIDQYRTNEKFAYEQIKVAQEESQKAQEKASKLYKENQNLKDRRFRQTFTGNEELDRRIRGVQKWERRKALVWKIITGVLAVTLAVLLIIKFVS